MSRPSSGFTLPQRLSPELCQFLGLPNGSSMSPLDVTKQIYNYARENSLVNGREINPNAALRALLTLNENDQLNFFNFQRYFRHNYLGPDPVAALQMQMASMNTNDDEEEEEEEEEEEDDDEDDEEDDDEEEDDDDEEDDDEEDLLNDDEKNRLARGEFSVFVQPQRISNELCYFLGLPNGSLIGRTDASRSIHNYIRNNRLQDSENIRVIHPDATLRELLRVPHGDQLTYFNLQRFLGSHFFLSNI
jgi:chromatin remodeling complex protein RSC6